MNDRSQILQIEYQKRFQKNAEYRDLVWKILCNDFFGHLIPKNSALLDLGCGWGEFSRNIKVDRKYAMDLNPDAEKHLPKQSTFIRQDCSQKWPFQDEVLDIIFTSNFLEHLPNKEAVDKTLAESFRCLKPGGKMILLGPNIKYLYHAYWDFWDHYIPISDVSLSEVLELQKFRVLSRRPRFLPFSMSNQNKPPPLFLLKLYLKLPFLWIFFGKQFLIIAEKPILNQIL